MRGYMIASSPRSGSNFLCELLRSTGVLGAPQDWFNAAGIRRREDPHYPLHPEAQLAAALTRGMTPNGVFGLKMFCQRFDTLSGFEWVNRLPELSWVYLERRDLLAQAISDVRSVQTDRYRSTAVAKGVAHYDADAIRKSMQRYVVDHARWRLYFARNAIVPLHLVYEDISDAPQHAVDAVAALMGVDPAPVLDQAKLTLAVQRDALSEVWRARYLEENRGLEQLDTLALKSGSRATRWWKRIWA